jgi:hypothetical protein
MPVHCLPGVYQKGTWCQRKKLHLRAHVDQGLPFLVKFMQHLMGYIVNCCQLLTTQPSGYLLGFYKY